MRSVTYITRPYFNDIALELIQELKHKCLLNVVINISTWNIDYLEVKDDAHNGFGKSFKLTESLSNQIYERYASYFEGANIIFRYEEHKETSVKNTLSWMRLLSENKSILQSDLIILESLSVFADWYLMLKLRNKRLYYVMHDPVPHSGERHRASKLKHGYYKYVDKFLLYSTFSTDLFNDNFPQHAGKAITLQTPIYSNLKIAARAKTGSSRKKVLFFGRISPYKGVELFYSAAEQLSKEFPDVLFTIAGKSLPNYSPDFLVENANPNIQIMNKFIDLHTLSKLMTESTLCVLPYLDATQSGVVMTAYAYDLPVLVSDCPGLLEYCFDPANFSFKNGDLNDLIVKMQHILLDESLIKENKRMIASYANLNVSENNVSKILA